MKLPYARQLKKVVIGERVLHVSVLQDFAEDDCQKSSRPSKMIAPILSITAKMKKDSIAFSAWITTKMPWFHQSTLERRW